MDTSNLDSCNFIITQPEYYHKVQSKTLNERIDGIAMSEKEKNILKDEHAKKVIKDKVLGSFSCGDLISTLLDWNNEVNEEIKEAKKNVLLETYLNKVDKQEMCVTSLRNFLSKPHGYTLFSKILQILDNNPPDKVLIDILSNALKYMIDKENVEEYFDEHNYALSQLEYLPIQSLLILKDRNNYPNIEGLTGMFSNGIYTGEWVGEFSEIYSKSKGINDIKKINRIIHSVKRLASEGYLLVIQHNGKINCMVTEVGSEILKYIEE